MLALLPTFDSPKAASPSVQQLYNLNDQFFPFGQSTGSVAPYYVNEWHRQLLASTPYGSVPLTTYGNGVSDDTAALNASLLAACPSNVGGQLWLDPTKRYLIDTGDLIIPQHCKVSVAANPVGEQQAHDYIDTCNILLNPSYSVKMGWDSNLEFTEICNKNLITPANMQQVISMVAGFSGTGIKTNGSDVDLRHVMVLGFGTCYDSENERLHATDIYGDCTNGMIVNNGTDIVRVTRAHFTAFSISHLSFGLGLWGIGSVAGNGSGLYRVHLSAPMSTAAGAALITGNRVVVSGVQGAWGANGAFIVTVVDNQDLDLQGSASTAPVTTGNTDLSQVVTGLASMSNVAIGQGVSGTGIPSGTTVLELIPSNNAILISKNATATNTGVTLTFANSAYTSGGNVWMDGAYRSGAAYTFTNSQGPSCTDCFDYGHATGFHLGTGAQWVNLTDPQEDGNLGVGDPTTVGFLLDSNAELNHINGGYTSSVAAPLVVESTATPAVTIEGTQFAGSALGSSLSFISGGSSLNNITMQSGGAETVFFGSGISKVSLSGYLGGSLLYPQNATTMANVSTPGLVSGSTPQIGAITFGHTGGEHTPLAVAGSSLDDTNQGAQITIKNTGAGVSNPSKSLRVNASGNVDLLSNSYGAIFSWLDNGEYATFGVKLDAGAPPTFAGSCPVGTPAGGAATGTVAYSGAGCSAGTVTISVPTVLTNGLACGLKDLTTPANVLNPTASSVSTGVATETFTGNITTNDVLQYSNCVAY